MILEKIPEIQRLTPQERLILASELLGDFQQSATPEMDHAVSELIRERMAYFEQHPASVRTWDELKRSIGKTG